MHTDVDIAPDLLQRLRGIARDRGVTVNDALNEVLRRGMAESVVVGPYKLEPQSLGLKPGIDVGKALALAAELEDDAIAARR